MNNAPTIGWFDAGKLGAGTWVCGANGAQIAVFYGENTNPRAAADIRLALSAGRLLIAAQQMLFRPEVCGATNNGNPGMAQIADELAAAIREATGEEPYKARGTHSSQQRASQEHK